MFQTWIKKGLDKGITDLEIYAVEQMSLKLSLYQNKIDQHVKSDVLSVKIKGIYNDKLTSVGFENLNETNIDFMLDALIENAKTINSKDPAIIFEGSESYPVVKENNYDFNQVPITDKINLIKELERLILENEYVTQVSNTVYVESATKTTLVNSKGLNLSRKNSIAYAYAVGVFAKDEDIQTAYKMKLAKTFDEFNAKEMANQTIELGVKKLGGGPVASGSYPTVFSNETFSELLGAFSSIFIGESAHRNLTTLKGKEGEQVFSPLVTIIDDPLTEKAYFQDGFDDEGVATMKKEIVKDGVFQGFIHNLKTAKIFDKAPTGNGFGGGTSMSNCYLEPGTKTLEETIKPIENGIYITGLVGTHAGIQTVSGEFSLQASGFKIENGLITSPVKMIVISGNFFKMMNDINTISSNLEFQLSGFGSPSVYINQLMIGGK